MITKVILLLSAIFLVSCQSTLEETSTTETVECVISAFQADPAPEDVPENYVCELTSDCNVMCNQYCGLLYSEPTEGFVEDGKVMCACTCSKQP